jgi:hypothetical protein
MNTQSNASALKRLLTAATSLMAFLLVSPVQAAERPVNSSTFGRVAIEGYDPVAYFKDSAPAKGLRSITAEWRGAHWRFATEENRAAFQAEPERFAPQYGGYCAWAVSQGYTASIDPEAWHIRDGRLYLNYSPEVQQRWLESVEDRIREGDANWPKLIEDPQ